MYKKAFTLLELLVVIAVIGIIMMFLIPVIGRAREAARRAQCGNNLRQIGIAMHMYVDEHDFKFPYPNQPAGRWYDLLGNYMDDPDVWQCPAHEEYIAGDPNRQSCAYNMHLRGLDINGVLSSNYCMMITDSVAKSGAYGVPLPDTYNIIRSGVANPGNRHSNGANIVFVDGHVKWYLQSSIPSSNLWWNN